MKTKSVWLTGILFGALIGGCGKVEEKAAEVSNDINLKGYWLVTESEHSSKITKLVEKESMVLTFKDGKAAFSPTDSVKGQAVYAALSKCTKAVRPYRTEKKDVVFEAVPGCAEKRVTVNQLSGDQLKFTDVEDPNIIRTFVRVDEPKFQSLVKATDRRP